jgi:hypothetical protein
LPTKRAKEKCIRQAIRKENFERGNSLLHVGNDTISLSCTRVVGGFSSSEYLQCTARIAKKGVNFRKLAGSRREISVYSRVSIDTLGRAEFGLDSAVDFSDRDVVLLEDGSGFFVLFVSKNQDQLLRSIPRARRILT